MSAPGTSVSKHPPSSNASRVGVARADRPILQVSGRLGSRDWLALFGLGLALWLTIHNLALIMEVAGLLFGALLLGLALNPAVSRMSAYRIPRGLSAVLLYMLLSGLFLGMGELLVPLFNAELSTLQSQGPALWSRISSTLSNAPLIGQLIPSTGQAANALSQQMDTLIQAILHTLGGLGNAGLDVGVVLILAYYGVVSQGSFAGLVAHWVPWRKRGELERIARRVLAGLGRWVRAQPLVVIYFAVGFSLILAALRVPFSLAIGIVGGVLSVIPILGGALAILLGVLSALTVDPTRAVWVTLGFLALIEIEVHLVAPAIFGRALKLHPGLLLMAMLIGIKAGALIGLLYSIPLTVVAMVVLDELRSRWIQGPPDRESLPGSHT